LAKAIVEKHGTGVLVLEVGSNDGTLLKSLSERGARAIGIEPSESLCLLSEEMNLNVVHGMLDEQTVSIALPNNEKVDVVVANNVFAHIDDIAGALDVISRITGEGGSFIFEVAHLQSLIEKSLFDTIYHEHMSYHSVLALEPFLGKANFKIYDVEKIPTHGGSIRVFARKVSDKSEFAASSNVESILEEEITAGLNSPELLVRLRDSISRIRESSRMLFSDIEENYVLFGYGAPAKLVTFMNEMDLQKLPFIGVVDDNIDKQGKFLPGSGIPIVPNVDLIELAKVSTKPLAVVIFPWNLKDEIVEKLRAFLPAGSRAIWLLPSPEMVTF
jgi:SAM-dependent methyltransferase